MSKLRFYRIEVGVIDYDLSATKVQEVMEKHFGFVMQATVREVNPFKTDEPVKKPAVKKPAKRAPKARKRRSVSKHVTPKVEARIQAIKAVLGDKSMTLKELESATGLEVGGLTHALLVAENNRLINVVMQPNHGTRAIRLFKNP